MACVPPETLVHSIVLTSPQTVPLNSEIMGRLDHLVELVYDRFVNRYFSGESTYAPALLSFLVS